MQTNTHKETQEQREARCHEDAKAYYMHIIPPEHIEWFIKDVEFGAKWVDNGDKIII